jgi:hypothetical protein
MVKQKQSKQEGAMSALEQEIIDKFRQLDHSARQRVLAAIEREAEPEHVTFDYAAWWADVAALQADIRSRIGENRISNDVGGGNEGEEE